MSDKLKILSVCPGLNWSSSERSALREALTLRDQGHHITFYVLRDSRLAYEASRSGLPCEYHTQGEAHGPLTWGRFLGVGQIIRKNEIQVVHAHFSGALAGVWPLCYLIREWPTVPLVISRYRLPARQYRGPIYRALAGRIDLGLTSGKDLAQELSVALNIPRHKLEVEGPAISIPMPTFGEHEVRGPGVIGVGLSGPESDSQTLAPLLMAYSILFQQSESELPQLALVAPKKWEHNLMHGPLRLMAREQGIEANVVFVEGEGPSGIKDLVLWVAHEDPNRRGPHTEDELQDYALEAILLQVPVLLPRRGPGMEFLRQYSGLGETYRPQDPRDLMAKIKHLLANRHQYQENLLSVSLDIQDRYAPQFHAARLLTHYRRLLQKRQNFLQYRLKKRPEKQQ